MIRNVLEKKKPEKAKCENCLAFYDPECRRYPPQFIPPDETCFPFVEPGWFCLEWMPRIE